MNVRFTPRARQRARIAAAWWRAHRPEAPDLFEQELEHATGALTTLPASLGTAYASIGGTTIRRLLLAKTEQHVYYSIDAASDVVIVHTIWGARRGRGPKL